MITAETRGPASGNRAAGPPAAYGILDLAALALAEACRPPLKLLARRMVPAPRGERDPRQRRHRIVGAPRELEHPEVELAVDVALLGGLREPLARVVRILLAEIAVLIRQPHPVLRRGIPDLRGDGVDPQRLLA